MANINELSDDLLLKILSFLPIKDAISTSVLSKQWEFLWMWLPKLKFDDHDDTTNVINISKYFDFIDKNLSLHRAPVIESLRLRFGLLFRPEDLESWAKIAVSLCVRKLSIRYYPAYNDLPMLLPSSVYTCKSLVTLKLDFKILMDVPPTGCLPSLKTLQLKYVTYSNEDSLGLLLSCCPVLEELIIVRSSGADNLKAVTVIVPSLQRLSITMNIKCYSDDSDDGYVIVTPSLKYFKLVDCRDINVSYLIKHMPKLEEVDIDVEHNPAKILMSITSVKRLSLHIISKEEPEYHAGIVFGKLEHLKLHISNDYWSKLLVRLLKDSPKLRVLSLHVQYYPRFEEYQPHINFDGLTRGISVPKCLLESLELFNFEGYKGRPEERDFLSFLLKNARCLTSSTIRGLSCYVSQ